VQGSADQKPARTEETHVRPNTLSLTEHKQSPIQLRFAHMQGNTRRTNPMHWFNGGLIQGLHENNHGFMGPQKKENELNSPATHMRNAPHTVQEQCRWNGGLPKSMGFGRTPLDPLRMLNHLGQKVTNFRKRSRALDDQVGGTSGSAKLHVFDQTRAHCYRPQLTPTSTPSFLNTINRVICARY
jgi:hypothetical protein